MTPKEQSDWSVQEAAPKQGELRPPTEENGGKASGEPGEVHFRSSRRYRSFSSPYRTGGLSARQPAFAVSPAERRMRLGIRETGGVNFIVGFQKLQNDL
jgi:hypothetical protein